MAGHVPRWELAGVAGAVVLKAKDTWPRTGKIYCHPTDGWPAVEQGLTVSDRGHIPIEVMRAYLAELGSI